MKLVLLIKATLALLLMAALTACAPSLTKPNQNRDVLSYSRADGEANVSVYLSARGDCQENSIFILDQVEVHDGEKWTDLGLAPARIQLQEVSGRQKLLGFVSLPTGEYGKIRLHVTKPVVEGRGIIGEEGATLVLSIANDFNLSPDDSKCLFIDWSLEDCSDQSITQVPSFSVYGQSPAASGETLYVVCDDIETIYFVRSDTHSVTGSMGFPSRLGQSRYDSVRKRLYVLGTKDRIIYSLNPGNNKVIDRIPLPSLVKPEYLALSLDGVYAFVSDSETDKVVKIDLVRRLVDTDASVGVSPGRIIYFEQSGRGQLAIASQRTQQVYIVDPETLAITKTLEVDTSPGEVLFRDGLLYVCDLGGNTVAVFNLVEQKALSRISVSMEPISIASSELGRIFVGHASKSSISVIGARQLTTQRRIQIDYGSDDLVYFDVRQMLYAAHSKERKVSVIDLSLEKKIKEITFGGTPFSLEMQN